MTLVSCHTYNESNCTHEWVGQTWDLQISALVRGSDKDCKSEVHMIAKMRHVQVGVVRALQFVDCMEWDDISLDSVRWDEITHV